LIASANFFVISARMSCSENTAENFSTGLSWARAGAANAAAAAIVAPIRYRRVRFITLRLRLLALHPLCGWLRTWHTVLFELETGCIEQFITSTSGVITYACGTPSGRICFFSAEIRKIALAAP